MTTTTIVLTTSSQKKEIEDTPHTHTTAIENKPSPIKHLTSHTLNRSKYKEEKKKKFNMNKERSAGACRRKKIKREKKLSGGDTLYLDVRKTKKQNVVFSFLKKKKKQINVSISYPNKDHWHEDYSL